MLSGPTWTLRLRVGGQDGGAQGAGLGRCTERVANRKDVALIFAIVDGFKLKGI